MNVLKDIGESSLSHDELMLKELERRDGIYSFIFHELESPKQCATIEEGKVYDGEVMQHKLVNAFATDLSSPISCTSPPPLEPILITTITSTTTPTTTYPTSTIRSPIIHTGNGGNGGGTFMPHTPTPILATAAIAAPQSKQYQEFLRTWQPQPSLVYEHPKLYAYMANCGFRVRVATPRFSHITMPLVRNRRHALKDSPEYKRCEVCTFKVPDLRALFPLDPDVHAPFAGNREPANATMLHFCAANQEQGGE